MCKNPKFSIIVPIYNVEKYLSFCIESLINQTLKDIEIICVNDGSTDKSLEILEAYAKEDDRIQIIDKLNGGLSSARNVGLDMAEGEYVLFVDSDDCLNVRACDRLYMEILQANTDIIVFGTQIFPWRTVEDQGWLYDTLKVRQIRYDGNCVDALFGENSSKPFVWNECYRRQTLEEYHIRFDESVRYGEDMIFLFQLFPRINSVVYIPDQLYMYRCERENSLMDMARCDNDWKLKMHFQIIRTIIEDWNDNNYLESNKNQFFEWCTSFVSGDIESISDDKIKKEYAKTVLSLLDLYNYGGIKKSRLQNKQETRLRKIAKG